MGKKCTDNISVNAAVENARNLLNKDKSLSFAVKAAIETLLLLITILAN